MRDFRSDLKQITQGLVEQAENEKRQGYTCNELLREYYDLVDKTLLTFDQWKEKNYSVRKGEHSYHFWGKPKTMPDGKKYSPVAFLFSEDQVILNAVQATT